MCRRVWEAHSSAEQVASLAPSVTSDVSRTTMKCIILLVASLVPAIVMSAVDVQPEEGNHIDNARNEMTTEDYPDIDIRSAFDTGCPTGYFRYSNHSFVERVSSHGYSGEEHSIVTKDGYILRIFRLWSPNLRPGNNPVILMHGLLQSSDAWIDSGPDAGLAYFLADAGFDVWIGNVRGNFYSRRHRTLDPDKDAAYWDFSRDEIGKYDIPATLDKVLYETNSEKVSYIGFSQGAGSFFMMCSNEPQSCNKASIVIALAPSTRHLYTRSIILRPLSILLEKSEEALAKLGVYEVFAQGQASQRTLSIFCSISLETTRYCEFIIKLLDGRNPGSLTPKIIRTLVKHFPAGTSVHNMANYGQAMKAKEFKKFDYGTEKNFEVYGTENPAIYNLSSVSVPVVVVGGKNDGIVDIRDVKWAAEQLPNVLEFIEVEDSWTHLDNTYSVKATNSLHPRILQYLNMYNYL